MQVFWGTVMLLTTALPTPALAQDRQVNVIWFEDASCTAWTKSAGNKAIRALYDSWIRGFVSGHNYASPSRQVAVGTFPASDPLYQYLDQYCHDNPKSSFVGGAISLVEELRATVAPAKSAPAKKAPAKAAAPAK